MLSTIDRYLLGRILRTLLPTGAGLGFMFFLAAWFRLLKEQDLSLQQVLLALPWFLPLLLPYLLPLAYLCALALVYGRMVADNEALAFSSLGVRGTSLAAPALVLGAALSVFSSWASSDLVPYCYRMQKEALRAVFRELFDLGEGEHLSRSFPSQGFDLYVRDYDGAEWRGVVLKVEVGRSGNDPSRATPVLLVAERATLLDSETGDLEILLRGVRATAYPGGSGAFDEAVLASGVRVTHPIRAGAEESLLRLTLGGRRRVKEADYASADLRRQVADADRRAALAAATGGVSATRAGQRDAALNLRLELVNRAAISAAPLLLAALLVPLVLLLRARSAVIPLVLGLLMSCVFYFVPLLAGFSFAETLAQPALGYLGCGVAVVGAGLLAWRAGRT
ncbi:MAG: LptF/LptG family permease [Planctomycetes bacterium]|nr:LptF/LptG family permease [Planctomycetota bacterium]